METDAQPVTELRTEPRRSPIWRSPFAELDPNVVYNGNGAIKVTKSRSAAPPEERKKRKGASLLDQVSDKLKVVYVEDNDALQIINVGQANEDSETRIILWHEYLERIRQSPFPRVVIKKISSPRSTEGRTGENRDETKKNISK